MNRRIGWVFGLVCFTSSALTLRAVNPDLILAPTPQLSQGAWIELHKNVGSAKSVTLHAQITAVHGSVRAVAVQEIQHCPQTASEVQSWIQQKWKFVPGFSGTVVQPIAFSIVKANALPAPANRGPWKRADGLFSRSPKPPFPYAYRSEIKEYQIEHGYLPGVLLRMTARNGEIVDIRVLDQKGPQQLCYFTVEWIRQHWRFGSGVSGTFRLPVYYELD